MVMNHLKMGSCPLTSLNINWIFQNIADIYVYESTLFLQLTILMDEQFGFRITSLM